MSVPQGFARRRRGLLVSALLVAGIALAALIGTIAAGWSPKLGLDLAGGLEVVLQPAPHHKATQSDLNTAVQIIRERVSGLGVSGATVDVQGNQVIVQIPGVSKSSLINQIKQTAELYFRPVLCGAPNYVKPPKGTKPGNPLRIPTCNPADALTAQNLQVTPEPSNPNGFSMAGPQDLRADPTFLHVLSVSNLNDNPKDAVVMPALGCTNEQAAELQCYPRLVLGPAFMAGTAVASADAETDTTGAWVVNCTLTAGGTATWAKYSDLYFHTLVAIELNGQVVSSPVLQPTQTSWSSYGNSVQISGSLSQAEANNVATALQYGSLPVPLVIQTSYTVSPTLGHADLIAGLGAGIAGLFLVLLYVVGYYRLLGLVVLSGLALSAAILWALISALGRTSVAPSFDLAGVTGIIVSIGINVDSYIVYFERLKDETRSGRSVRTSLERGFASAWRTVLAADTVSFLAALLLFFLAAGSVQGFAFFLGLSTILDIVVTWFFTRPTVALLGRNERLTSLRGMGIARGLAVSGQPS